MKLLGHSEHEIFVVDDDLEDFELMKRAFNNQNTDIGLRHLRNGEELLQELNCCLDSHRRQFPNLVLLDLSMPILDGREALSELKKSATFSSIPVIVFSSSHANEDVESSYELGANSFISKPTSLAELQEVAQTIDEYWLNLVSLPR